MLMAFLYFFCSLLLPASMLFPAFLLKLATLVWLTSLLSPACLFCWIPAVAALSAFSRVHAVDGVPAAAGIPAAAVFWQLLAPSLLLASLFPLIPCCLSPWLSTYLHSRVLTDNYYQTDHFVCY
jgi:hypothetical protein